MCPVWLLPSGFSLFSFMKLPLNQDVFHRQKGFYLPDPCELTFANTLLLSNAAISLGNAFISLEISSQFLIFFSLFSFILDPMSGESKGVTQLADFLSNFWNSFIK